MSIGDPNRRLAWWYGEGSDGEQYGNGIKLTDENVVHGDWATVSGVVFWNLTKTIEELAKKNIHITELQMKVDSTYGEMNEARGVTPE